MCCRFSNADSPIIYLDQFFDYILNGQSDPTSNYNLDFSTNSANLGIFTLQNPVSAVIERGYCAYEQLDFLYAYNENDPSSFPSSPDYSYLWSDGTTTSQILCCKPEGLYTVTITHIPSGCFDRSEEIKLYGSTCEGGNDGDIFISSNNKKYDKQALGDSDITSEFLNGKLYLNSKYEETVFVSTKLLDMQGRLIKEIKINQNNAHNIKVGEVPTGVYVILTKFELNGVLKHTSKKVFIR